MKSFEESKKADRAVLSVNKSHPETRPTGEKEVTVNGKEEEEEEEEEEEAPGHRSIGEEGRAKALAKLGLATRGGGRRGAKKPAKKPASQ